MKTESRGVSSPSFAVLRELARIYKESLQQTLFVWPARFSTTLIFDSGLDSFWKKSRWTEIFEPCVNDLKAQLGPAYQNLFGANTEDEFEAVGPTSLKFRDVMNVLENSFPEWSHEYIIDKEPRVSAPLYQIHNAVDEHGVRWQIKVIKPLAKSRLESTLYALREIELTLKPLRRAQTAAKIAHQLEELRRSLYREADLSLERRTLLRMKTKAESDKKINLRFPRINERFANEAVIVYEQLEGTSLAIESFDARKIDLSEKAFLARKPLQCSVLKAFEMGLIRTAVDSKKLVLMKDGVIGVRDGWMKAVTDGNDRIQAANLLRSYFAKDFASLNQEIDKVYPRPTKLRKAQEEDQAWQERLAEHEAISKDLTLVDFAELVLKHTESIGLELPQGFLETAQIIYSLQGIGKTVSNATSNLSYIGADGRAAADQDIDLSSHIVRASRIRSR